MGKTPAMVVSVGSDAAATARSDENQDGTNEQEALVASSVETSFTTCCWKDCKKVDKSNAGGDVRSCERPGCKRSVHAACAANMLAEDCLFAKTPRT
ncbi:hypothetical protein L914_21467 [Phytophthora nicotianae]|uniref:Uncharacterized protein n=1 Tax=Phytophthora nicotianae TaxID=4792 RepID=W2M381_PHYNI|nr:hypothetical protein L914_21467 [Phytophthora nicotianae]